MVERNNKTVLVLVLSFVFILIFLGFANACTDPCNPSCNVCGDGHIGGTEQCDNGNPLLMPGGLNGVRCDPVRGTSCTYCNSNCETAVVKNYCGDWETQVNAGEECDDGNNVNGDGCSALCKVEKPISCIITVSQPTSGWYRNNIPILWSYSSDCDLATQLIQRQEGSVLKDIKYIGNNYIRSSTWSSGENWFAEGNFSICLYAGLVDHTNAEGCSSKFGIDLTPPTITVLDRNCNEGETITLTASATDALSGVDASTWQWDLNHDGNFETSGQTIPYTCGISGSKIVSVKVSDNVWNYANKDVIITINSIPQICDHNISIRYNYVDTFNTGIGISENGIWLNNIVNITKDKTHSIKYRIENNKETDDNVHIVVKADNNIVSEYNQLINEYHAKTLDLDISNLQCNAYHTISVNVTSDGKECDLSDNYASRQIYVYCPIVPPTPFCGDGICNAAIGETCSTCASDCGICPPPTPFCGDGICNAGIGEICSTCSSDCGICPPPIIPPCNGEGCCTNNGFVQFCDSNWKCSPWSQCSNGVMTRKCTDTNNCDIGYNKPYEQTNCNSGVSSNALVDNTMPNNFWLIVVGIILFVVLLIVLINML